MKKLKKLILQKDVVANLSQNEMKEIKGGATLYACTAQSGCTYANCNCTNTCPTVAPTPRPTSPPATYNPGVGLCAP